MHQPPLLLDKVVPVFVICRTQVLHHGILRPVAHTFSTVGSSGLPHTSSSPWDLQACRTYVPHRGIFRPVAHTFSTGDLQACRTQGGRLVDGLPFVRFAIVTICKKPDLQAVRFASGAILQEARFANGVVSKRPNLQMVRFARGPICKRCYLREAQFARGPICKKLGRVSTCQAMAGIQPATSMPPCVII